LRRKSCVGKNILRLSESGSGIGQDCAQIGSSVFAHRQSSHEALHNSRDWCILPAWRECIVAWRCASPVPASNAGMGLRKSLSLSAIARRLTVAVRTASRRCADHVSPSIGRTAGNGRRGSRSTMAVRGAPGASVNPAAAQRPPRLRCGRV